MSPMLKIFLVDDDLMVLTMLSELLRDDFDIETFTSGEACVARLGEGSKPDLFLVDVSMPGMDGYAFCRYLKDDFDLSDIPVAFVSANDDIETRMLCYEAGGDDFYAKPFEPAEMIKRLKVLARAISEKRALHEQAGYATRTAMSAMTSMGELGIVLQFLSKSFACHNMDDLGTAILQALGQYDLTGAVQLRVGEQTLTIGSEGYDVPLEVSVMNHVRNAGRIFQFKTRCVFNYGNLTVMVNNMPVDDPERCGRIRDNGALLAEGADARLRAIEMEDVAQRRREGIEAALPRVHSALNALHENYRRNCFELTRTMLEYQEELLQSFVHLGLSELQEEQLTSSANSYMQRLVGKQDESLVIVGQLEEMARTLEDLLHI